MNMTRFHFLLCVLWMASHAMAQEGVRPLEQYALTHAGDAEAGRDLFRQAKVTKCLICHKVADDGGQAGPDLSAIGGKFDRPHLIESLLEPSKQIVEGYRRSVVILKDGRTVTGVVRERSHGSLTLFDVDGNKQEVATADIDDHVESDVSLMPDGLAKDLTPQQFTDLIAYLETLRPGGKPKPGAGITGPISLPENVDVSVVATNFDGATALELLPDGRIFVCEQTGSVRVIEDGNLLDAPFVTLPVDSSWERGVIGVAVDPGFPEEPFVYVCWVASDPYPHHRVSRFRANGNVAEQGSEEVLLFGDDQTKMGGNVPNGHQGGGLHFGPDGCLYIGIGEQTAGEPAQELNTFLGKILRINRDGSIPADNPFVDQTTGKYRAIWAYGCRNPFTFAFRGADGLMLINDVGGTFEEINVGVAGANYGWPTLDHGPRATDTPYVGPIHWYPQASIAGGDFHPKTGRYFFADFNLAWIHSLDPDNPADVEEFAVGLRRPVDLRFAGDGGLYVLLRNAWVIDGKFEGGTGSLLKFSQRASETHANSLQSSALARPAEGRRNQSRNEVAVAATPEQHPGGEAIKLVRDAFDESAGSLPAFRIETPSATYYLEKSGAGLSSLIDRDGNDWLNFHPEVGTGAAGEYRGFPNAVHNQSGSFFHPKNRGTQPSTARLAYEATDRIIIEAVSENKLWACRHEFFAEHATFTMTRMPADRRFWVLYEGTPGGQYDDDDWWMTSTVDTPQPMTNDHDGDIPAPEWIAFGDKDLDRSLLLLHHEDDRHPDRFYQMEHKMTVFGFGREGLQKYLDHVPQSFSVRLVESRDHVVLNERAQMLLRQPPYSTSGIRTPNRDAR